MPNYQNNVDTITISSAIKDYENNGFSCKVGDKIGAINEELVSSKEDALEAFKETISKVENIEDKCALVVFMGKNAPDDLADQIQDYMYDNYDFIEVSITIGILD